MKHLQLVITLAWLAGPAALAHAQKPAVAVNADAIYFGGAIVTMDDTNPGAEAIAVKDGKIVAVGKKDAVLNHTYKGPGTKVIDLSGKTMLPGFVDGHSHFINSLLVPTQANCYSPPAGPADSIPAIIKALRDLQTQQHIEAGDDKFIMAYGYDMNGLAEQRELTAADLDEAFPNNPVIVGHVSLHGAVLNTKALQKFKITADTQTPAGGVIARKPGSNEPAGLLMETAYLKLVLDSPDMPHETDDEMLGRFKAGQEIYAAAGITTAQEGATHEHDVELLQGAAKRNLLFIDVVAYPFIVDAEKILAKDSKIFETYQILPKPPEVGRDQNHYRWLSAGQDGLFHNSLSDRWPNWGKGLVRRADVFQRADGKVCAVGIRQLNSNCLSTATAMPRSTFSWKPTRTP